MHCPQCGYCQHCGRSNQPVWTSPYQWPYRPNYFWPTNGGSSYGGLSQLGQNIGQTLQAVGGTIGSPSFPQAPPKCGHEKPE